MDGEGANGISGFIVVQTDSYPQLLNPPPSIANSPASTRYYPAGKPPLLIARGTGPGVGESLLYNSETVLEQFGTTDLKAILLDEQPRQITLQVGADESPLQLVRSFRLKPRRDLPKAQVFSPSSSAAERSSSVHSLVKMVVPNSKWALAQVGMSKMYKPQFM